MINKKDIDVEDSILMDYFLPQKDMAKDIILSDLIKSINFDWEGKQVYIRFKLNKVVIFKLNKGIIESIETLDYDYILGEDFLHNLIKNSNKLDRSLKAIASYEYMNILKEEIIKSLNLNEIKIYYDSQKDQLIGEWEYTEMKFYISKHFQFKNIIRE